VRSDWTIALCTGEERLKGNDKKEAASDPEARGAARPRDPVRHRGRTTLVLDPFSGHRHDRARWPSASAAASSAVERDAGYAAAAARAASPRPSRCRRHRSPVFQTARARRRGSRSPTLVERGMIAPGDKLTDAKRRVKALVRGRRAPSRSADAVGSIHRMGALAQGLEACKRLDVLAHRDQGRAAGDRCAAGREGAGRDGGRRGTGTPSVRQISSIRSSRPTIRAARLEALDRGAFHFSDRADGRPERGSSSSARPSASW